MIYSLHCELIILLIEKIISKWLLYEEYIAFRKFVQGKGISDIILNIIKEPQSHNIFL